MALEDRRGTHQQRVGEGVKGSLNKVFQPDPDAAADDVLNSLITQINGLKWPCADGKGTPQCPS